MPKPIAKKRLAAMEPLKDWMRDPRIRNAMQRICTKHDVRDPYQLAVKHPKVFDQFVDSVKELSEEAPVETVPGFLR